MYVLVWQRNGRVCGMARRAWPHAARNPIPFFEMNTRHNEEQSSIRVGQSGCRLTLYYLQSQLNGMLRLYITTLRFGLNSFLCHFDSVPNTIAASGSKCSLPPFYANIYYAPAIHFSIWFFWTYLRAWNINDILILYDMMYCIYNIYILYIRIRIFLHDMYACVYTVPKMYDVLNRFRCENEN